MDYPVFKGNQEAGKVQILKEGLYCRVICRCQLTGNVVYRLAAISGDRKENLGVLVPEGDGFGLNRRIPAKQLQLENPEFQLIPSHPPMGEESFLPLQPEEPFAYIEKLENAYLVRKNGRLGICIRE